LFIYTKFLIKFKAQDYKDWIQHKTCYAARRYAYGNRLPGQNRLYKMGL